MKFIRQVSYPPLEDPSAAAAPNQVEEYIEVVLASDHSELWASPFGMCLSISHWEKTSGQAQNLLKELSSSPHSALPFKGCHCKSCVSIDFNIWFGLDFMSVAPSDTNLSIFETRYFHALQKKKKTQTFFLCDIKPDQTFPVLCQVESPKWSPFEIKKKPLKILPSITSSLSFRYIKNRIAKYLLPIISESEA